MWNTQRPSRSRGHLIDSGVLSRVLDDILRVRRRLLDRPVRRRQGRPPTSPTRGSPCSRRRRRALAAAAHAAADPRRQPDRPRRGDAARGRAGRRLPRRLLLDDQPRDAWCGSAGSWVPVEQPGDGLRRSSSRPATAVRTIPVSDVQAGDRVVCGAGGREGRAAAGDRPQPTGGFEFMNSEVSSEKPQALLVRQIAQQMRDVKADGQQDPLGRRPGRRAHRRGAGDGGARRGGLRRRAVRRQRARHPRHRVVAVRHLARRRPPAGPRRRARARAPHPRDQPDPPGRARSPPPSSRAC